MRLLFPFLAKMSNYLSAILWKDCLFFEIRSLFRYVAQLVKFGHLVKTGKSRRAKYKLSHIAMILINNKTH